MGRLWNRLTQMSRAELIDRGRQALSKRADTLLAWLGVDLERVALPDTVVSGKFFFADGAIDTLAFLIRRRLPQQVERVVAQADKILTHKFDLLGYADVDMGDPIDWHRDTVHGTRSPIKPFYKIRYLDFAECGDSKVVWELNRHQHLVTLARAYRLTGDRRYADEVFAQWDHWHAENLYPYGINWASTLEVGFRSLAWLWVYHLLAGTPAMPEDFPRRWLQAQARNGRHIERYLSTYFSANTHLLGEAVALFFLGVLCPQLPHAEKWKSRGWQIILAESRHQVLPDGFHFEQSVYYHVYALDLFLHSLILARCNGMDVPAEFERAIEKMLDALFLLGRSGGPPGFGDDDGGRVFDPRRNQREHLLDPLATGAILFRRPDYRELAGDLTEETMWLLGEQGIAAWDAISPSAPEMRTSALASAGYYLLTTSEPPSNLVVDGGPQGAQNAGHAHADALSVCLQSQGRSLLIDPGTLEYVGEGRERDRFRGTEMHNTACIDGRDQSEPAGPFAWKKLVHGRLERWISGQSFDLFVGSHDGYARIHPSIVHRRWVLALRNGLFLVRDVVMGAGAHRVDVTWHLGPQLRESRDGSFRDEAGTSGILLLTLPDSNWGRAVRMEDWSPVYGKTQKAPVVRLHTTAELPVDCATLLALIPRAAGLPNAWNRIQAEHSASQVRGYRAASVDEEWQFFFAESEGPWRSGEVASDGRVVAWQRIPNGTTQKVILCDGSYIEIAGKYLLKCARLVERCELSVRSGVSEISSSEPSAIEGRVRP